MVVTGGVDGEHWSGFNDGWRIKCTDGWRGGVDDSHRSDADDGW
jgi:hypothetical protein